MPRSDYDFFILLASQRLGFCWLGDFPIAQLLPMGFGCKCLIIMFLVFLGFPFATCFIGQWEVLSNGLVVFCKASFVAALHFASRIAIGSVRRSDWAFLVIFL